MTSAARPLIAFVGPSISQAQVTERCPHLELRPPIQRGDLYREREAGAWGFLIIDGVFMQHDAVSPREVVDVLTDGALVIGASSMGALRAADCWPAGAIGVGMIYRMFRLGVLESDEEVAVAISTEGDDAAVSLPLVNVRFSLSRAVRGRLIGRDTARLILDAARDIYYPQRSWRRVMKRAKVDDPRLLDFCKRIDLKHRDAEAGVALAARYAANAAELGRVHARKQRGAFQRSEQSREAGYDLGPASSMEERQIRLLRWMLGSGRAWRHVLAIVAGLTSLGGRSPPSSHSLAAAIDKFTRLAPVMERLDERPTALRVIAENILLGLLLDEHDLARRLWHELAKQGELDAELMRLHALERAVQAARENAWKPRSSDWSLAREQIALNHGFGRWQQLLESQRYRRFASLISDAAEKLATAKRVRDAWFNPPRIVT